MEQNRRIGKFFIQFHMIDSGWKNLVPIMSHVVVISARALYERNAIEYVAFSDLFDEVDPSIETPEYTTVLTMLRDGSTKLDRFEKRHSVN